MSPLLEAWADTAPPFSFGRWFCDQIVLWLSPQRDRSVQFYSWDPGLQACHLHTSLTSQNNHLWSGASPEFCNLLSDSKAFIRPLVCEWLSNYCCCGGIQGGTSYSAIFLMLLSRERFFKHYLNWINYKKW